MTILDAHCDAPSQMLRLRDFGVDNARGQVDFPKMHRGGVDASFYALYIPAGMDEAAARSHAARLMAELQRQVLAYPGLCAFAGCSREVEDNKARGLVSVIPALENGSPIGGDLSRIHELFVQGIRYITLTHSADNAICDSCTGEGRWHGLSPFGREAVKEMNRCGMMVDLAHCSDDTMKDVLEQSDAPVAYTHGCCRALSSHRRNISDEMMKAVADKGGVVGMSIYPSFLSDEFRSVLDASGFEKRAWVEDEFIKDPSNPEKAAAWYELQDELCALPRPGVSRVVDHIIHAVEICGSKHVGFGTDYDGIEVTASGLENIACMGLLIDEMTRRGFSKTELEDIAGANFLRLLDQVQGK